MTQEEKNELMERLGPQDYEAYMELRRQMDVRTSGWMTHRRPRFTPGFAKS